MVSAGVGSNGVRGQPVLLPVHAPIILTGRAWERPAVGLLEGCVEGWLYGVGWLVWVMDALLFSPFGG